ncbi:MAG: ABC transporter ATP-binding protein [Candidatus Tectimicrobiota bacterium]
MAEQTVENHIEVRDLVVHYGDVMAVKQVSFTVRRGEHLTLLGPSGCGKTTTLRSIAGLEQPSAGDIRIGGQVMYSSSQRVNIPTEKRGVSMVFQSYAIWPHMTVFENVAYGLRVRRLGKKEIEEKVLWALDLVRLRDFAQRSAAKLSGGQQQRVALARSFAFSPTVILFDEPLSNLDAKLRAEMRLEIKELQYRLGITSVYVTHDQEEALAISDRVIVMNTGIIEQIGTPGDIYDRPRSAFVADFVGAANLVRGRVQRDTAHAELITLETAAGALIHGCDNGRGHGSTEGAFSVRTVYPWLTRERPAESLNVWEVRVNRRVFLGDFVQYLVDWGGEQLVIRRPPIERFEEGETVYMVIAPEHCVLLES